MKNVLPILIAAVAAASLGWAVCHGMRVPVDGRDFAAAGSITLPAVAGAVGTVRVMARDAATQDVVAQAGLVATVVHLFLTIALAAGVWTTGIAAPHAGFLVLLLAFYWSLLAGLVVVLVRRVAAALPAAPAPR